MARLTDYGAFMEKFLLNPIPSEAKEPPLKGLTFAVKEIFDVEGYVTGFGNPDWARTHSAAISTAPAVLSVLKGGATCVGKTVMDEMAYSINGENIHYGTPLNPCAPDRVPGGSSSGSAVAVAAKLVDFSLGTDTGGSVRVPASYCGILGFRPSHDVVCNEGVIPMAQSFDTVGWFAHDPEILNRVGHTLLELPEMNSASPNQIIIAEDCFKLSSIPCDHSCQVLIKAVEKVFGGDVVKNVILGEYVEEKVPHLKYFMSKENKDQEHTIPSLAALSSAMRLLQKYEFRKNHGEWIATVKPELGPGISERVWDAMKTTDENIDACISAKAELRAALTDLLGDFGILAIPIVPGPPPKLQMDATELESFRAKAFSFLSIAGMSGFCQVLLLSLQLNYSLTSSDGWIIKLNDGLQVSIPLGLYENLPVSISLLAKHGSDFFLLNVVETLYQTLQELVRNAE